MPDNESLCKQVLAARENRDELKQKLKLASEELESLEKNLASELLDSEEQSLSCEGMQFSASTKTSWKTSPDGKEALLTVFREWVPELVKESINASTLSSYLKKNEKTLESKNEAWWVQAKKSLVRKESPALSIRKSKKKSD